jgi:RNA polymerase-binding transcription factor DksA
MSASAATIPPLTSQLAPGLVDELRKALLAELVLQEAQVGELGDTVDRLTGEADVDSQLEREIAERSLQRATEVVADIGLALERIAAGTYGSCERCGNLITVARLEALPFTRHCVDCPPPPALAG